MSMDEKIIIKSNQHKFHEEMQKSEKKVPEKGKKSK